MSRRAQSTRGAVATMIAGATMMAVGTWWLTHTDTAEPTIDKTVVAEASPVVTNPSPVAAMRLSRPGSTVM